MNVWKVSLGQFTQKSKGRIGLMRFKYSPRKYTYFVIDGITLASFGFKDIPK